MTAQFSDNFLLDDLEYALVGISDSGLLFDPQQLGLHPLGTCSACWRGSTTLYTLNDNQLQLKELNLILGTLDKRGFTPKRGPAIHGIVPEGPAHEHAIFNNIYRGLNLPLAFSGGLLLGREALTELFVNMGFHPAWKYQTVFELIFEAGYLTDRRNVSKAMQEYRKILVKYPLQPGPNDNEAAIRSWIDSTFSLDYSF